MFLEAGFDNVKVVDIARACGVTEKTVFNHFPSKEALLVDRWDELMARVRTRLDDPRTPALAGVVAAIWAELDFLTGSGTASRKHMSSVSRFGALMASSPALQDHRRRNQEKLGTVILLAIAQRMHTGPDDPEALVTAEALSALFTVFYRSLGGHAPSGNAASCRRDVRADVERAAQRLEQGISL
jgi:AcrR family transcriptional regulator